MPSVWEEAHGHAGLALLAIYREAGMTARPAAGDYPGL